MRVRNRSKSSQGVEIVSDELKFSMHEICVRSGFEDQELHQLVEYGVVTPLPSTQGNSENWYFSADTLRLLVKAERIRREFELDAAGLAISLELLEELQRNRRQLEKLRQLLAQHMQS